MRRLWSAWKNRHRHTWYTGGFIAMYQFCPVCGVCRGEWGNCEIPDLARRNICTLNRPERASWALCQTRGVRDA